MTETSASPVLVKKSKRIGPSTTAKQEVCRLLKLHGELAVYQMMDLRVAEAPNFHPRELFTEIQGYHSACSTLYKEGEILRMRIEVNPHTGEEVYVYALNNGVKKPPEKTVTKAYKEKYEDALATIGERDEQIETLIMVNDKLRGQVADLQRQLAAEQGKKVTDEQFLSSF